MKLRFIILACLGLTRIALAEAPTPAACPLLGSLVGEIVRERYHDYVVVRSANGERQGGYMRTNRGLRAFWSEAILDVILDIERPPDLRTDISTVFERLASGKSIARHSSVKGLNPEQIRALKASLETNPLLASLNPKKLKRLKVLDAGTGDGATVTDLRAMGVDADGLDLVLNEEQKKDPHFIQADIRFTGLGSESYDEVISAYNIFYYREKPEFYEQAIAELARILKPGGRLVVINGSEPGVTALLHSPHFRLVYPKPDAMPEILNRVNLVFEKK